MSNQISAKEIGKLRKETGSGIIDCKKHWSKQMVISVLLKRY